MGESRLIAKDLLKIKAVFLSPKKPFTWASGIISPIYCDNRLTLSFPGIRNNIEEGIKKTIEENFPECEILMGTSTAGIAHAAIAAHLLNKPMGYVRGSKKTHGRENQIEGRLLPNQKVVVVEDLISTGGSVIEVVDTLRENNADVIGIVSIFTYGMKKAEENLKKAKVKNISLSNLDVLLSVAVEENYIEKDEKDKILKFRDNPKDESWR